jgi:hypothetical protein
MSAADRHTLLRDIARRQAELERASRRISRTRASMEVEVVPLVEEARDLCRTIHALFDELLRPGRLAKRARTAVSRIYKELVDSGQILPLADGPPEPAEAAPSAPRDAADGAHPMTRDLYRKLAKGVHPDLARDEGEKTRRTEAMKKITTAYARGDVAGLVALEKAWLPESPAPDRMAPALRRQLRDLDEALDEARALAAVGKAQVRGILEDAREDLEALHRLHEFVRAFRDGKMPLARFLAGPDAALAEDELAAAVETLLGSLANLAAGEARRKPRGPRKRKRKTQLTLDLSL